MLRWLNEEEIENLLKQIPGNSVEDKGILAMLGGAMRHYEEQGDELLFNIFLAPHIQDKFPRTDDLMEGLGKRLKDVGGMIMNFLRKKPRG